MGLAVVNLGGEDVELFGVKRDQLIAAAFMDRCLRLPMGLRLELSRNRERKHRLIYPQRLVMKIRGWDLSPSP
ncbi:hypothetical protein D3C80_1828670 [compost metagenome]